MNIFNKTKIIQYTNDNMFHVVYFFLLHSIDFLNCVVTPQNVYN